MSNFKYTYYVSMHVKTDKDQDFVETLDMSLIDPEEVEDKLLRELRNTAEVVLDMETAVIGGQQIRTVCVTRFLRAAGPVTERIGWKVMPEMGFIVDITAVA